MGLDPERLATRYAAMDRIKRLLASLVAKQGDLSSLMRSATERLRAHRSGLTNFGNDPATRAQFIAALECIAEAEVRSTKARGRFKQELRVMSAKATEIVTGISRIQADDSDDVEARFDALIASLQILHDQVEAECEFVRQQLAAFDALIAELPKE